MRNLTAAAFVAVFAGTASADIIADWAAAPNGASIAATNVIANVSGISLTRGAGLAQATGGTFNSNGWDGPVDLAGAIAANHYLEFGVTVAPGFSLNLSDVEIRYDRSSTGPSLASILLSTDGTFGAGNTIFSDASVNEAGEDNFFAAVNNGLTGNVVFRLYAWGATGSTGTFDIETIDFANGGTYGIRLNGTVVPAPASAALMGLGGLLAARRRR